MSEKKTPVTIAHFWTDPDTGKDHTPGEEVKLVPATAQRAVAAGVAQFVDDADADAPPAADNAPPGPPVATPPRGRTRPVQPPSQ